MTNWVRNELAIETSSDNATRIDQLITQLSQPFAFTHESLNEKTGMFEGKITRFSNPVFAFWNVIKPKDLDLYLDLKSGNDDDTDSFYSDYFHDWNLSNWGTKWDVANQDDDSLSKITSMEITNTGVKYVFNTAWSVPLPAILKLSEQYPELEFQLACQHETGWGGVSQIKSGSVIKDLQYDSKCLNCESIDSIIYIEEKNIEECKECGSPFLI